MEGNSLLEDKSECPPTTAWTVIGLPSSIMSGESSPYDKYSQLCGITNFQGGGGADQKLGDSSGTDVSVPNQLIGSVSASNRPSSKTLMLTFADSNVKQGAAEWYNVLNELGYTEQRVVAMDQPTSDYLQGLGVRYDLMPYSRCNVDDNDLFSVPSRNEIYALRWKYIHLQLVTAKRTFYFRTLTTYSQGTCRCKTWKFQTMMYTIHMEQRTPLSFLKGWV